MAKKIVSPCISICKTDPVTGYCYGCARTNEEKKLWKDESTNEKWKEVIIPFDDFEKSATFMPKKLKADTIRTIGLVAYGKDHNADVSIANLEFY